MSTSSLNPAETYEQFLVPALFGPSADRLIDAAAPRAGEQVLDIACGTGVVARAIVTRLGGEAHVTSLDANPAMLEVARATARARGLDLVFDEGKAEMLPFSDASFDLVTCQFGLMFFTDRAAALREMHRVLVPGGRLVIATWQGIERHPLYLRLANLIEDRFGISDVRAIFALGNEVELRELVADAGFTNLATTQFDVTATFPDPGAFLNWEIEMDTAALPQMQHLDAAARADIIAAIAGDMAGPIAGYTTSDGVVLPFHAWLVTARKEA